MSYQMEHQNHFLLINIVNEYNNSPYHQWSSLIDSYTVTKLNTVTVLNAAPN